MWGGRDENVQDQLVDVRQLAATESAFAAVREDGCVVTWGHPRFGGDCRFVEARC